MPSAMASHLYENPEDPFEMVSTPFSDDPMEAWRASTLATGTMGAFDACMQQFRDEFDKLRADTVDLTSLEQREQALIAREQALSERERQLVDLIGRATVFWGRLEQKYTDAARFDAEPLASPPGDEPSADEPTGDPGNKLPEPSLDVPVSDEDPAGEFLRLAMPVTAEDQIEFPLPEDKLPVLPVAQPIAVEFDTTEFDATEFDNIEEEENRGIPTGTL